MIRLIVILFTDLKKKCEFKTSQNLQLIINVENVNVHTCDIYISTMH